jgi:hypothetical protein
VTAWSGRWLLQPQATHLAALSFIEETIFH